MNFGTHDNFDQIKKISKFGQNQTIATPTSHTTEISKSRNSHSILMIFGRIVEPPILNQKILLDKNWITATPIFLTSKIFEFGSLNQN